jgi:hypothetical protein
VDSSIITQTCCTGGWPIMGAYGLYYKYITIVI